MRKLFACVAVLAAAGFAPAADEIKLADFKVTPKFKDSPAELTGHNEGEGKLFMYIHATATAEVEVKADGTYAFSIELSGDKGMNNPKVRIGLGGKDVEKEFALTQLEAKVYTFKGELKKGKNKVEIEFLNDEYKENEYDANLYIHSVKYEASKPDEKKEEKKDK